jgi:succinate dehydrogenase / fumarate reductase flavoprotein subunit
MDEFNPELEKAGRVADFIELGELMVADALDRRESAGGHFREESQTPEGEAMRDDENFAHASAWEFKGVDQPAVKYREELEFDVIKLTQRSYQ